MNPRLAALLEKHYPRYRWLIPDAHLLYPFPGGWIYVNPKESLMMLRRVVGRFEPDKRAFIERSVRPGSTFVDVGSCMGDYALIAARRMGGRGRIIAVEPEPGNADWIMRSVARNRHRNIAVHQVALGEADGEADLFLGGLSSWHSLLPDSINRAGGAVRVRVRSLDSLMEGTGDTRVDLVKIDVEGADVAVLKGARGTFESNRGIVIVMDIHPQHGVDPVEVCGLLADMGFVIYGVRGPGRRIEDVPPDLTEIVARR